MIRIVTFCCGSVWRAFDVPRGRIGLQNHYGDLCQQGMVRGLHNRGGLSSSKTNALHCRATTPMATSLPRFAPAFEARNAHLHFLQRKCITAHSLQRRPFLPILKWAASASASSSSSPAVKPKQEQEQGEEKDDESMSIDALHRFFDLNLGSWSGSFCVSAWKSLLCVLHFVCGGLAGHSTTINYRKPSNLMGLSVSSYGDDDLISLIQTLSFLVGIYRLYIKQPPSATFVSDSDPESEWMEYKIKETNMFTVDKYQQIGYFPKEKAFALRYQTAGMLETVLRAGVLGEDDTGEESPNFSFMGMQFKFWGIVKIPLMFDVHAQIGLNSKVIGVTSLVRNLKLPSRRPSVVCENCIYSLKKDMRARAFHIMDPKGFLEMHLIFLEERKDASTPTNLLDFSKDNTNRIAPWLGKWKGHSITKRSGVYGATIAEADTVTLLEMNDEGQLIQDVTSTSTEESWTTTNVHWTGTILSNLVVFDGGFQITLLPGGMYMGCPSDVGKSVAQLQSFHLEFCWMESPTERQRLIRTYDSSGLAVSSTYIFEVRE
ncbi:hypothetical protein ACLOJK_011801 [Asimina triloba]